eukprot:gnl/Dysnectes_brevis/170_a197_9786.p2 GENE.gnl/Dysnectes_brevis/170_a197_9786~~gnl/Dysnectes_brevis/170_a197_9786.p2  ORF type:complete len:244 (-),score=83.12 gnl/Dysnectes_brevis/170_a197_9786:64-795(-)
MADKTAANKFPFKTLCKSRPMDFGIGNHIRPMKDLTRFVRWPRYIRIQRQRTLLKSRLKVPGQINQFIEATPSHVSKSLIKFASKYTPETSTEKKERLAVVAKAQTEGQTSEVARKISLKFGLAHVTSLIERKEAKLVLIAHDVEPIELVMWMPALCHKMGVPYAIVKGKSELGKLVHMKKATCVAITEIEEKDRHEFSKVLESVEVHVDYDASIRKFGGGLKGIKSQHKEYLRKQRVESMKM